LERLKPEGQPLPDAWQRLELMENATRRDALNNPAANS